MNRNELMDVDLAVMNFLQDRPDAPMAKIIRAAIDAAEPLIRADERERQEEGWAARLNSTVAWAENGVRADLRAKVEALQAQPFAQVGASGWDSISRAQVLALFDGGSDE